MIQPLRRAHRRAFGVLAVVLPATLLAGLAARHPHVDSHPFSVSTLGTLVRESDGLWRKHAIRTVFYRDGQRAYVELRPANDLSEPDLLLYWISGNPPESVLPAEARFLGAFSPGKAFALPDADAGSLVLYSLGHQAVVDTAVLEKLP